MSWTNAGGAAAALIAVAAVGCGAAHGAGSASPLRPPVATNRGAPTATASAVAHPSARAVGLRAVTMVDSSAGTPARGPTPPRRDRVLRTLVWYPATAGDPAAALPGPFPLVVFAHGFDATPRMYAPLLREVAAAGYVVAAPRFPISASDLPGTPREDDMADQALDVRATVSTMLALSAGRGWLRGRLDAHAVAIMGHSDGGETVAGNVLVPADRDGRVRAAVILAGQLPTWGPLRATTIPTLVVQGSADTVNPPALSLELYRRLGPPRWYLDVIGGTHLPAVVARDLRARTLRRAVIAFLDATLRHDPAASIRFHRLGNQRGVTLLTVRRTG